MYLLLVENNYISSREIKSLLVKNDIECEVINCSSSKALLDIAEKISPDIVIIDFDFYIDDSAEIVNKLRQYSPEAYILAFVDPDHLGKLNQAIEMGIDNYMVKPLQRVDVMLRIRMGLMQKSEKSSLPDAAHYTGSKPEKLSAEDNLETISEIEELSHQELLEKEADDEDNQYIQFIFSDQDELEEEPDLDSEMSEIIIEPETFNADWEDHADDFLFEEIELSGPAEEAEKEEIGQAIVADDILEEPELEIPGNESIFSDDISLPEEEMLDAFPVEEHLEELNDEVASVTESIEASPTLPEETDESIQYFEKLFSPEEETENTVQDIFAVENKSNGNKAEDLSIKNEAQDNIDDRELFGISSSGKKVDTSSFEELFDFNAERDKKKRKLKAEPKKRITKPAKVEYLAFDKNQHHKKKSSGEKDIFDEFFSGEGEALKGESKGEPEETKEDNKSGRLIKTAGNILTVFLLLLLVSLSFFLVQSRITGGTPTVFGYQVYVVLSGSMSPAFNTGSIIFVKPTLAEQVAVGDIITFSSPGDAERLTTHRVVDINRGDRISFVTRGDANNVNDPNPVAAENLVGRVTGSIPLIGYLLSFVQTRQGLILLIFIPGIIIIALEVRKLFKNMVDARVQQLNENQVKSKVQPKLDPEPDLFSGSRQTNITGR